MNFKILKTCAFWTRLAIFEFVTVLAILSVPSTTLSDTIKVLLIVLSFPLYFFSETGIGQLLKIRVKQEIQTKLSQVDTLEHLNKSQNLRSNIFLLDKKHKHYYIAKSSGRMMDVWSPMSFRK